MSLFGGLTSGQGSASAQQQALIAAQQQAQYQQAALAAQMYQQQAATTNTYIASTSSTAGALYFPMVNTGSIAAITQGSIVRVVSSLGEDIQVNDGRPHKIHFPDGTVIDVKANGSFEIQDENATVVYKANRSRDFNPFINASDKLESFIKFCGEAGVRQGDVLEIPIKHFIAWLIVESARADNEPEPDVLCLPNIRSASKPRCRVCQRFMSRKMIAKKIEFCRPRCFEVEFRALTAGGEG